MSNRPSRLLSPLSLVLATCLLGGCATGQFVWVDDFKPAAATFDNNKEYVIGAGDIINVRVFNQEQMSARERVRSDGKVSLPFLNDILVAGLTPRAVGAQLQTRLRDYINNPVVTVAVEEPRGISIPIVGEVVRPGVYNLDHGTGVLQALVMAGGLNEFAGRDRLYVLRPTPPVKGQPQLPTRIRFHYWELAHAEGLGPLFQLRAGDTLVAE